MKRWLGIALFSVAMLAPAYARQIGRGSERIEEAETQKNANWKWINFGLLALGLGYLIAKKSPAFFNARSEEIQKAIKDATGLKLDADFRSSEIDRRMATLAEEVQKLRAAAKKDMEREGARIDNETRIALQRIHEHTLREIDSLQHQAALAVREHAIRLATELAITELREHPEQIKQDELIRSFAADVLKERRAA
jgi:F0F1-type ATP synthase membrane subunit b/b'